MSERRMISSAMGAGFPLPRPSARSARPIQVQSPGEERQRGHRNAGCGQRADAERTIGDDEHRRRDDPEQQPHRWRPRHRRGHGGPAGLGNGIMQRDNGRRRHGQP